MRLTELVQDPLEEMMDDEPESQAETEGRQAVIDVVNELKATKLRREKSFLRSCETLRGRFTATCNSPK